MTPERLAAALRAAGHRVIADLFCDEQGFAFLVGVSTRTVRRWREDRIGPQQVHIRRLRLFDLQDVAAWLSTKESGTPRDTQGHSRLGAKDEQARPEQNVLLKHIGGT